MTPIETQPDYMVVKMTHEEAARHGITIDQLKAPTDGWIKAEPGTMPKTRKEVLVCAQGNVVTIGSWNTRQWCYEDETPFYVRVTHWMPLPKGPTKYSLEP